MDLLIRHVRIVSGTNILGSAFRMSVRFDVGSIDMGFSAKLIVSNPWVGLKGKGDNSLGGGPCSVATRFELALVSETACTLVVTGFSHCTWQASHYSRAVGQWDLRLSRVRIVQYGSHVAQVGYISSGKIEVLYDFLTQATLNTFKPCRQATLVLVICGQF